MADFQLSDGTGTFDFDIAGNVSQGATQIGTWTVNPDNTIGITRAAGGTSNIPVDWGFNDDNQFELRQAGVVQFNFHGNDKIRPDLSLHHAVLNVAPDTNGDFTFGVHGDWSIDAGMDLIFTAGTVASAIDGVLSDTDRSEFSYVFFTKAGTSRQYILNFTGKWQQNGSGADVDFVYDKPPAADGTPVTGTIVLPPGLTVDSTKNVLVYTVKKDTQTSRLELAGTILVHSNFGLTYVLDSQDDAGIRSTTFSIAADIKTKNAGEGNLQLSVQRSDGIQTIQIGGFYRGVIAGVKLQVGFTYMRTVAGQTTTDLVGFDGKIVVGNTDVTWNIQASTGGSFSIDITAHVAITATTCISAALNFTRSGQNVAITAMFGINTGCSHSTASVDSMLATPQVKAVAAIARRQMSRRRLPLVRAQAAR
jgi:hypothetical protein